MNMNVQNILKTMGGSRTSAASTPKASNGSTSKTATGSFWQALSHQAQRGAAVAERAGEEIAKRHNQADKAAGDLISNALILPMLKQLRRSPWGENTVFSRGIGEKTFGPQFDMHISDRIAHSPRLGLKTALTQKLLNRGSTATVTDSSSSETAPTGTGLDVNG
jgi:hypothetical protein